MSIRIAKGSDVQEITALVMSLSHYYLPHKESSGDALQDKKLPDWLLDSLTEEQFLYRINSDDYNNFVYVIGNEIAGYISMKAASHIYHLFVLESHQRKCVASALWQHVLKQSKAEKYTLRSSLYAIPVYKKWGFVEMDSVREKDEIKFQEMALIRIKPL